MKICKKFVAILMAMLMVSSLFAIIPTASAATVIANPDIIGKKDYKITNPYKTVNWDTWKIYRAATHIHSNISDGEVDFADMVEAYYDEGYDAIAMTDHGTVNYGWSKSKSRHAIFAYQLAVHGEARGVSNARASEMASGIGRGGQHMTDIKYGNELNGACLKKVHINSFFADCGDGYMGMAETWPTSAVDKSHDAGGLTHLNHIGEWSGADEDITVYDNDFISDLADIFETYSSCVGMELVNKGDGRTRNDRYLYDRLLMRLAPQGRNIFGFCEDDAHELDQIGKGVQFFVMPSNTMSNVRTAMTNGTFFASSRSSRGELSGYSVSTAYEFPYVTKVEVDEVSDQIRFNIKNAHTAFIVADGNTIDTISCKDGSVCFDLNKYESSINRYVRCYFIGNGGITYAQPFLLSSTTYKRATTQFVTNVKGAVVTVTDSNGNVMTPINNDHTYILPADTYSYTATCVGCDDVTDTFTVTAENISAGTQKKISLPFVDKLSGANVTFYVPETIYLATNSSKNFKYYTDRANISNGVLTASAADTSGNIYFACGEATSVTIKVDSNVATAKGANSANYVSGAKATGQSYTGTITSGTLAAALSANAGKLIKWTATYTLENGTTKSAYAYSYVYRPSSSGISIGMDQIHTYSTDVQNMGLFWGTGFHAVGGGTHTCYINFNTSAAPMETYSSDEFKEFFEKDGIGSTYYYKEHSSNAADEHVEYGGTGTIYVDSSRITNLNQIPNLKFGFWQYSVDGDDNVTAAIKMTANEADTVLYNGTYDGVGELFSSSLNLSNPIGKTGTTYIDFNAYTDTSRGNRHNYNSYNLSANIVYVNKASLRDAYNNAIYKAYTPAIYDSTAYSTFLSAVKSAGSVLGNPKATQTQINNAKTTLTNAQKALKRLGAPTVDDEQKFIYGVQENLNSLDTTFYPDDGYYVSYEGTELGTGTKVQLISTDAVTNNYELVIFGDVDGNGIVDGDDSFIVSMILGGFFAKDTLGAAKWFAADVNFDGTIDAADLDLITKAGLKQHTINQRPGSSTTSVTTADDITVEEPEVETTPLTPATIDFTAIFEMIRAYIQQIIDTILSFVK